MARKAARRRCRRKERRREEETTPLLLPILSLSFSLSLSLSLSTSVHSTVDGRERQRERETLWPWGKSFFARARALHGGDATAPSDYEEDMVFSQMHLRHSHTTLKRLDYNYL